ncbi:anthranilate synthase component I family protein [Selenomonas ruminis]|uniref:Anthranilate synthase component I family protein n=1 Tax=Selenomonas ruminis TaxID=2593411 RepID=A0A5D6W3S8_9FIRM|nr:anthranilate synthase component I family protein [Selenomonas sp. mPRGC5]TYZ21649.1 anthranilate synthase component I family protein [Selenomonas sp. mPRGC5]
MELTPSRAGFCRLAKEKNLIAVSTEINMDMDTPVSVYYKLVDDHKGFILESVDTTHQQFGRYSFIGAEPFARLQVFKNRLIIKENDLMKTVEGEPTVSIRNYMKRFSPALEDAEIPLANGGMVGYFNYEIVSTFDRVRGLDLGEEELLGQFMICRILVVYDALRNNARLIYFADVKGAENPDEVYGVIEEKMAALKQRLAEPVKSHKIETSTEREPVDFLKKYGEAPADFLSAIRKAKEYIFAGDIFQVVPSRQFRQKITKPCFHFYRRLRQVNPSPYMFYFNFGSVKLVGASPEMLVKVAGDTVYTYPIAGTRRRGKNAAEDQELAAGLKDDTKEVAEHSMLVDLARNDIGRISEPGTVKVTKLKQVEFFSHVMHMVSEVTGKIKQGYAPMDVLRATFPAGTVSGAPKLRAMEIIHELEPVKRNTYSGTVGYMDFAGNMDMCITLRTMRIENDDTAIIQSGAGIVADSVPEKEYQEILQKSKALFEVVEEVENDAVTFA